MSGPRQLLHYIETGLREALQWAVFEPNDERLWAGIRASVAAFMQQLFVQGALQGTTPGEAYFVSCDGSTTTQDEINRGVINVIVGFAPVTPAEFVIVTIQQIAGQNPALQLNPYQSFKFRVKWDGRYVAGISKVGGLSRSAEPGPLTLERGVTLDFEFDQWAREVWDYTDSPSSDNPLKDFRRDITIETYDETGQLALAYKVFRCWVSEYSPLPEVDGSANAVVIQYVKLEHEGWERIEP